MMRVIAGVAKGLKLKAPQGKDVRPVTDRVKESLFNILGEVKGQDVLDLYAGSGSLGIEVLSRGANGVVFVDKSLVATKMIKKNLESTGFLKKAKILRKLAELALEENFEKSQFDLIFLDPPYKIKATEFKAILETLVQKKLVRAGGRIVLRHFFKVSPDFKGTGLSLDFTRRYGEGALSFYRRFNDCDLSRKF